MDDQAIKALVEGNQLAVMGMVIFMALQIVRDVVKARGGDNLKHIVGTSMEQSMVEFRRTAQELRAEITAGMAASEARFIARIEMEHEEVIRLRNEYHEVRNICSNVATKLEMILNGGSPYRRKPEGR